MLVIITFLITCVCVFLYVCVCVLCRSRAPGTAARTRGRSATSWPIRSSGRFAGRWTPSAGEGKPWSRSDRPHARPAALIYVYRRQYTTPFCPRVIQVYEDVNQCCQALSQRLGTQPYFFNKQSVSLCLSVLSLVYLCLSSLITEHGSDADWAL